VRRPDGAFLAREGGFCARAAPEPHHVAAHFAYNRLLSGGGSLCRAWCGGDAVDVDEGLGPGVLYVVDGVGGDIGDLAAADLERLGFFDDELTAAGEEDEQLFVVFCAVCSAGLCGLEVNAAGAHCETVGFPVQESFDIRGLSLRSMTRTFFCATLVSP